MNPAFDPEDPFVDFYEDGEASDTFHLDVRKLLENGGEPYPIVMKCLADLTSGDRLVLHALFEPRPLIGHLDRMGLTHSSEHTGTDHWQVSISRPN